MRNWKTTLTGIATRVMALVTTISGIPAEFADAVPYIPPPWKGRIFITGAIATLILGCINAVWQKDKDPKTPPASPPALKPDL